MMHHNNITTYILLALLAPAVCLPAASSSGAAPEQSNVRTLQQLCAEVIEHDLLYNPSHTEVAPHFEYLKNNINLATTPVILSTLNKALINRIGWQGREFVDGDWSNQAAKESNKITRKNIQIKTQTYTGTAIEFGHISAKYTIIRIANGSNSALYLRHNDKTRNLERHIPPISDIAFSPNGLLIAAVTEETLDIWDAANNRYKKSFHKAYAPSFSPNGERLAYVSNDGFICIYDTHTGHNVKADTCLYGRYHDQLDDLRKKNQKNLMNPRLTWSPNGSWLMCKTRPEHRISNEEIHLYGPVRCAPFVEINTAVSIWNSTTGSVRLGISTINLTVFFSNSDDNLYQYGTATDFFPRKYLLPRKARTNQDTSTLRASGNCRSWAIYKSYADTLNTLAQLDQLSPEFCNHTELSQQYPRCANKALIPFLLTALQKGWRYNKPHSVIPEDEERWAALRNVAQSINNENLFEAEGLAGKLLRFTLFTFGK